MFHHLLWSLEHYSSVELKISIMHLINQIIDMYSELESRISMRLQFSAFNIEDIMGKIYDKGSTQLKQEIDYFTKSSMADTQKYSKFHEGLVSDKMTEGSDLASIIQSYSTRWSSSPNIRKIVAYTLSDLLYIPTDDTYGLSQWLFINQVVSQVATRYKSSFLFDSDDVQFDKIISSIETGEVKLRYQMEEQDSVIEKLNLRIKLLEETNNELERKLDDNKHAQEINIRQNNELEKHTRDLEEKHIDLQSQISNLNNQLTETLQNSKDNQRMAEENLKLSKEYKEKYDNAEKKFLQALTEEKFRSIKLEEETKGSFQKATQSLFPLATKQPPITTAQSDTTIPTLDSSDHDKEERRIIKAFGRYSTPTINVPPNNLSSSLVQSPQQKTPGKIDESLPDWRKRKLEDEELQAQRASQEHLRKLEVLKNLPPHTELIELDKEAKEVAKTELVFPEVHLQSAAENEEMERMRLEKALNRHSHVKK